jgi:disulfide bond formation protein DsbB
LIFRYIIGLEEGNIMLLYKKKWLEYNILLVSLVATLGSLYFSEVRGYVPCELCWYQRIFMYPIVAISVVGILRKDIYFWKYVLPFSFIGMFISSYHVYIQAVTEDTSGGICKGGVSCSVKYLNVFGFADIPFFALLAFLIINSLILVKIVKNKKTS